MASVTYSLSGTAVENLYHAQFISAQSLGSHRTVNLPGISVTVGEMLAALETVAGPDAVARVRFEPDATIARIVTSWPGAFDVTRAQALGFRGDGDFTSIVRAYLAETSPAKSDGATSSR